LTSDDHKKLQKAAEIFLIGSVAGTGALGAYARDFPMKTTFYAVSGAIAVTYVISKLHNHYKMKQQCKDCIYEKGNAKKIYKSKDFDMNELKGSCIAFKPEHMTLNCIKHKKYEE
jgi:hypothetical protein